MDPQNDFFTLQSLATFAGTVGATTVIANGCQRAFNFNPAWFALVVAELICIGVVLFSHLEAPTGTPTAASDYFIAIVNGFLVYCSAAGATRLADREVPAGVAPAAVARGQAGPSTQSPTRRRFFSSWF